MSAASSFTRVMGTLAVCLLVLPVMVLVTALFGDSVMNFIQSAHQNFKVGSLSHSPIQEKLLGGLLASGFDETSCLSRYGSASYRKPSPHIPSPYLIQRLRNYEALHRRCAPNTNSYNQTLDWLRSGHNNSQIPDCNYIIWLPDGGIGNKVLVLASAFLYALLTDRVLLMERGKDVASLFCEPFPHTSWLLPLDFPLRNDFKVFDHRHPMSFGNIVRTNVSLLQVYTYVHLVSGRGYHDMLFFCEQKQNILKNVPWLIVKSNIYFVPPLFLLAPFKDELNKLFPEKETVFHHLGRYLFHPSNSVWGLITRYYQDYLLFAQEKVGIQIRVFGKNTGPFQYLLDQILTCSISQKLLPNVTDQKEVSTTESTTYGRKAKKVVLMTSLSSWYYDRVRDMYWETPTSNGEVVSVFQASHEELQQTDEVLHDMKAWAEIYLLSLTDELITSPVSTFGYVAQGLGGLRPWMLYTAQNQIVPDPPCRKVTSMEPCFHSSLYDCNANRIIDAGRLVPHVRYCEDVSFGIKLFDV